MLRRNCLRVGLKIIVYLQSRRLDLVPQGSLDPDADSFGGVEYFCKFLGAIVIYHAFCLGEPHSSPVVGHILSLKTLGHLSSRHCKMEVCIFKVAHTDFAGLFVLGNSCRLASRVVEKIHLIVKDDLGEIFVFYGLLDHVRKPFG